MDRPVVVDLDEIKVKISAPVRLDKKSAHRHVSSVRIIESESSSKAAEDLMEINVDIEQGWEKTLKARLIELDPAVGEEIFNQYKQEKDIYARKLESMVREHQESDELDHLIDELDFSHQQRLQDIFGPYFEDLRELQGPVNQ